jgi:hypothetical protein
VLPLVVPHVPSVVTAAVEVAWGGIFDVAVPITGSPVVVELGGLFCGGAEVGAVAMHPFWHPLAAWQWSGVVPQYLYENQVSLVAPES